MEFCYEMPVWMAATDGEIKCAFSNLNVKPCLGRLKGNFFVPKQVMSLSDL